MDTSDTSDFESADEFFSDSEDVPDIKVANKPILAKVIDGKKNTSCTNAEVSDLQKPEQCFEPGMDYNVDVSDATFDNVEKLNKVTIKGDTNENPVNVASEIPPELHIQQDKCSKIEKKIENSKKDSSQVEGEHLDLTIEESPKGQFPRGIRATCWVPALNKANKKRRENEQYPPKPPTVDRDGNPIIHKTNTPTDLQISERDVPKNDLEEAKIESPENEPLVPEINIKTTCWIPELHPVDESILKQRMENEKHPPKPPTVDRDGKPIIYKNTEVEKPVEKLEDKDNLWETDETWEDNVKLEVRTQEFEKWDNNEQWEVEDLPDLNKEQKVTENASEEAENLWKDDLGSWGSEDTWTNQEKTAETPLNSAKERLTTELPSKADSSVSSDDNMWEHDTWESVENDPELNKPLGSALDNLTTQQSWSNWGNWGISSVLNSVSQGLTTVIGVPNPEEFAQQQHLAQMKNQKNPEAKEDSTVKESSESEDSFVGLGTIVSGVTKLVETTGTKVISGGLGTLETIGKKTMEVLQENDPGLKKKRAFLKKIEPEKTVLSQVLREAKEKAEMSKVEVQDSGRRERKVDYEILFDDYAGLVHIEALSMLSRQCSIKLTTILSNLSGPALTDLQETLDQVKELCELPEDSLDQQPTSTTPAEFRDSIEAAVGELGVAVSFAALVQAWEELRVEGEGDTSAGVYRQGVTTLARFTALAVEQLHKTGELLLVKERRSTVDEADSLVQISSLVISMLNIVTTLYTDRLNELSTEEFKSETNQFITNIFFESSNSTQYVKQACQLLIPVLQVGAT